MAKRRASFARIVRAPAPIIRVAAPAAPSPMTRRARVGRAVRRAAGSKASGMTPISAAVTSAVVGYAESAGLLDKLPSVPVIGRKGTLAIAAYWFSRHGGGKIARDVAIISACLAGYELGKEGKVSGNDDDSFNQDF